MKIRELSLLIPAAAWALALMPAAASTRSSANYAVVNESLNGAGGVNSSANYNNVSDVGGMIGESSVASPLETNNAGYVGQITYVTGLQLAASYTPDGTAQPIAATQALDDGTDQLLSGVGASWSVSAGQLPAGVLLDAATGVISGVPSSVGNYSFTITVTDGQGNSAMQTFSGTITETFAEWEASYQINDAPGASPFHDGVPTLIKYLCNINPTRPMTVADRAALPVVGYVIPQGQATPYLTLTYRQFAAQTGLVIQLQTSSDLKTWAPVSQAGQPAIPPDVTIPQGYDAVTGDPFFEVGKVATGRAQFLRLQITLP